MEERPLALYRRYLWEKKNIIFVYTDGVAKLNQSRSNYNLAFELGMTETAEQHKAISDLMLSATMAAESQMTREMWGWTVRLPFKNWGLFCGVEADGSTCCRVNKLSDAAKKDVIGAVAVQRVADDAPVRQTMLIPRDTQVHLIVEQYFDESEQLPARIAISDTEAVMALSMPQAAWAEVENLSEKDLIAKFHALLQDGEIREEKDVESEAEASVAERVRKQYAHLKSGEALSHGDLRCTHEAVFFCDCRCNETQMERMISSLPESQQKELWKGTDTLTIECPRCGRKHDIHKK